MLKILILKFPMDIRESKKKIKFSRIEHYLLLYRNENQDIDLVIQKNDYLIKENKELSEENTKTLLDLDIKIEESKDLYSKLLEFQTKVKELQKELLNKKDVIKK